MNSAEQRAQLYVRDQLALVYPTHRSDVGLYLSAPPFARIDVMSPLEIGAKAKSALSAFRTGVPTPQREEYPVLARARLEAAGVRSEAAFVRGARLISLVKKGTIVITPHRNGGPSGPKRGFEALKDKTITIPISAGDEQIGAACLAALEACE